MKRWNRVFLSLRGSPLPVRSSVSLSFPGVFGVIPDICFAPPPIMDYGPENGEDVAGFSLVR